VPIFISCLIGRLQWIGASFCLELCLVDVSIIEVVVAALSTHVLPFRLSAFDVIYLHWVSCLVVSLLLWSRPLNVVSVYLISHEFRWSHRLCLNLSNLVSWIQRIVSFSCSLEFNTVRLSFLNVVVLQVKFRFVESFMSNINYQRGEPEDQCGQCPSSDLRILACYFA
jgi:hypothetical protein